MVDEPPRVSEEKGFSSADHNKVVGFFHSSRLLRDADRRYYSNGLNSKVWSRYLSHFDQVLVVTRERTVSEVSLNTSSAERDGVTFCPLQSVNGVLDRFTHRRRMYREIEGRVAECDAIVVRLPSFVAHQALRAAKKLKVPAAIEVAGCAWDSQWNHSLFGKLLAPFSWVRMRGDIRRADQVLYVTEDFLQRRYPTNGFSVACSNVELISASKPEEVRGKSRISSPLRSADPWEMITIGSPDLRYKGHSTVLSAMSLLRKEGFESRYHIVGGGEGTDLKKQAEALGLTDYVIFHGQLSHEEVLNVLRASDIYIQPSLAEGVPRALIEAMSLGLPCIGSNAGGIPEVLPPNQIFRKRDSKSLAYRAINVMTQENESAVFWSTTKSQHFAPDRLKKIRESFFGALASRTEVKSKAL